MIGLGLILFCGIYKVKGLFIIAHERFLFLFKQVHIILNSRKYLSMLLYLCSFVSLLDYDQYFVLTKFFL